MSRVALVGLGRMGTGLCARLVERGFEVTAVDALPERRSEARRLGAGWAPCAAEAAAGAEFVLSSLPGPQEVAALVGELLPIEGVWVEMSSATPATAEAFGEAAVLDSPVAGGPPEAAAGRLVAFAGGAEETLVRARPLLDALCQRVVHAGPRGSGYALKLLVNALWFTQAVASAEVAALARRLRLEDAALQEGLRAGPSDSVFVRRHLPRLLAGDPMDDFALEGCSQELDAVLELAGEHRVEASALAAVAAVHRQALASYGAIEGELLGARYALDQPRKARSRS